MEGERKRSEGGGGLLSPRKRGGWKFKGSPLAKIVPSLVTLAALSCGASSVRAAFKGHFELSIYLIFFAAVFDGLDGHVARLLHAATEFGAELDSLCDLVDFGISPALIINLWAEKELKDDVVPDHLLWAGSIVFFCACAYRLARFNLSDSTAPKPKEIAKEIEGEGYTSSEDEGGSKKRKRTKNKFLRKVNTAVDGYITQKKFFQGVPAPVGGALALLPLVCSLYGIKVDSLGIDGRLLVVLNLLLVALLMSSKFPTLSSKMLLRDPRRESHLKTRSVRSLITKMSFSVLAIYTLYSHPWQLSFIASTAYYLSLPVGVMIYYNLEEPSAAKAK